MKQKLIEQQKQRIEKAMQWFRDNGTLSNREFEVLQLIPKGHTSKEIAVILNISPLTVEKHIQNMKEKLGVNNKTELTSIYFMKCFNVQPELLFLNLAFAGIIYQMLK